eukprot:gene10545-3064_t
MFEKVVRKVHSLPKLNFPLDKGIPPCMSPLQLEKHYSHHHANYVKNLNELIKGTNFEKQLLWEIVRGSHGRPEFQKIFNNSAQHFNHSFFWSCMKPKSYGNKDGAENLIYEITAQFGSFENLQRKFNEKALELFGSGWVWLVVKGETLEVWSGSNAETPIVENLHPLLVCDVWEHSYYVDYYNNRAEYMDNFWHVVDWKFCGKQYDLHVEEFKNLDRGASGQIIEATKWPPKFSASVTLTNVSTKTNVVANMPQWYDYEHKIYRIEHKPYCFPMEENPIAEDCTFIFTSKVGYLVSETREPRCCISTKVGLQKPEWTKIGKFLATAVIDGVKTKIFTQYPSGFVYMERDDNGMPFRVLHNRLLHANKSPTQVQTNYNYVRREEKINPKYLQVPSFCASARPCDAKTTEKVETMYSFGNAHFRWILNLFFSVKFSLVHYSPIMSEINSENYSFEAIFDNEESKKVFKKYMEQTYVSEMYEFLEQVDDYVLLRSNINRKYKAKKIVETYILPKSPGEINIPEKTRKQVLESYEEALNNLTTFNHSLFIPAQQIVHHDLTFDVFPRFVETEDFKKFMKTEQKRLGDNDFGNIYLLSEEQKKENLAYFDAYKQFKEGMDSKLHDQMLKKKKSMFDDLPNRFEFNEEEIKPLLEYFQSKDYITEIIIEMSKPIVGIPLYRAKGFFTKSSNKREFLGSEAIKWIKNYTFTSQESCIVDLLNFFIAKKIINPKDTKKTKFDPKGIYSFGFKKKVVIIGGGFSGVFAAKTLKDDFEVVVIDAKPNLEYIMSFYKVVSNPTLLNKYELPISKCVNGCKTIQGRVTAISPAGIYLQDKSVILFDYLIVATGSNYVVPFDVNVKLNQDSYHKSELELVDEEPQKQASIIIPYSSKSILHAYYNVRNARNIVIVGGGPVALECAGDLCMNYPNTIVNIITSGNGFLERRSKPIQKAATKMMQYYKNVKCYFNRYVTRIEGNRVYFKYKTSKEDVEESFIETEAVVIAVGFRPNTGLFRTFMSDSLSSNGFVSVNEFFQVKLNQNIYTNRQLVEETESFIVNTRDLQIENLEAGDRDSIISISELDEDDVEMSEDEMMKLMNKKDEEDSLNNDQIETMKTSPRSRNATAISFKSDSAAHLNIFAIGDIIDTTEEKLAYYGEIHGKKVANVILNLEQSINQEDFLKKTKPYISKSDFIANITIGNQGVLFKGDKLIQKGKLVPVGKAAFEKYFLGVLEK